MKYIIKPKHYEYGEKHHIPSFLLNFKFQLLIGIVLYAMFFIFSELDITELLVSSFSYFMISMIGGIALIGPSFWILSLLGIGDYDILRIKTDSEGNTVEYP